MFIYWTSFDWLPSTSVWGSELKYNTRHGSACNYSLPLCEVVSWNDLKGMLSERSTRLPLCEVVSWNKEILLWKSAFTRSTSVWGSELKYWRKRWNMKQEKSLPQCEVVSWNYTLSRCSFSVKWSTSVWGSELNVFEGSMWYCRLNPMMGKSGPQTFRACCTYSRSVVPERITVLI